MSTSQNSNVLIVFFSFLVIFLAGTASAQELNSSSNQNLHFVRWEGSFLSWHRQGIACWVNDDSGNLRFELMLGGQEPFPENLKRILDWDAHDGWTVISVESTGGTFSRWNEQWQELSPVLDTWLRVVVSQTSGGLGLPAQIKDISPGGRCLILPFFGIQKERTRVKRLQLPNLKQDTAHENNSNIGFRQIMVGRGHGRGGQETVLNLTGKTKDGLGTRITSSHQPGTLHLNELRSVPAVFNSEEVFLPWWPLSGILQLKM